MSLTFRAVVIAGGMAIGARRTARQQTHILVPYTSYSDYSGSSVEASNYRALLRDYEETFVDVYGGHGTRALLLPATWTPPDDGREGLLEVLESLSDDPLYDEEDHSAYEIELADEAWTQYLSYDVDSDLEDALDDLEGDPLAGIDDGELREAYYTLTREQNYAPECESATSVYFPFHSDVIKTLADRIRNGEPLIKREVPGQASLAV